MLWRPQENQRMLMNGSPPLAMALLLVASSALAQPLDPFNQEASGGGFRIVEQIGAYTPPPGREWASEICQHIPCALKDSDPIKPFKNTEELPEAVTEQKKTTPEVGSPPDAALRADSGGKEDGAEIAAMQAGINGETDKTGRQEAIKVAGPATNLDGVFTYTRLRENAAKINDAAQTFNEGQMPGFAAPNAPTPGTMGDPPLDEKYLGKIQAPANE